MNLEQLKYFIDVCETGNMTQSAKKFYISPQGLNKSLRSLQKELDVDLLIFQQRKTEMTEEGRLYYTQIKDLVRQLEQINDDIRRNSDKTLSVAISSNTYAMVQGLLEQFERTEPEVRVILSEYSDKIVEENCCGRKSTPPSSPARSSPANCRTSGCLRRITNYACRGDIGSLRTASSPFTIWSTNLF